MRCGAWLRQRLRAPAFKGGKSRRLREVLTVALAALLSSCSNLDNGVNQRLEIYAAPPYVEVGGRAQFLAAMVSAEKEPADNDQPNAVTAMIFSPVNGAAPWYYPVDLRVSPAVCQLIRHDCRFNTPLLTPQLSDVAPGIYWVTAIGPRMQSNSSALVVTSTADRGSPILFVTPDFTWQAYNDYQGRSLYLPQDEIFSGPACVGYKRPGIAERWKYLAAQGVIDALGRFGEHFDVASQWQFATNPGVVLDYDVVVLGGHDEYWTRSMLDAVAAWTAAGGQLINLSGNTMWWKASQPSADRICVDKGSGAAAENFHDRAPMPESLLGIGWQRGGFVKDPETSPLDAEFEHLRGRYVVLTPEHPAFSGLELGPQAVIGERWADIEVDGVPVDPSEALFNGRIVANDVLWKQFNYPLNLQILAVTPVSREGQTRIGAMVAHDFGSGHVFSGGTIGWGLRLADGDKKLEAITVNVLRQALRR